MYCMLHITTYQKRENKNYRPFTRYEQSKERLPETVLIAVTPSAPPSLAAVAILNYNILIDSFKYLVRVQKPCIL